MAPSKKAFQFTEHDKRVIATIAAHGKMELQTISLMLRHVSKIATYRSICRLKNAGYLKLKTEYKIDGMTRAARIVYRTKKPAFITVQSSLFIHQ